MNRLLDIGFKCIGHWVSENDQPVFQLDSLANSRNILYAFVCNGEVKYIGKTSRRLQERMYGYKKPGSTQKTNLRNHACLRNELLSGNTVDIFALPDNGLLHYGVFHVNLADGLEGSLIATLNPEWNSQGTTVPAQANNGDELGSAPQPELSDTDLKSSSDQDSAAPAPGSHVNFEVTLGKTYYNQGFFNIRVDHQRYLGEDRQEIEIYLGDSDTSISGYINRAVNPNHTPRIMGGIQLTTWLQNNFQLNDKLLVQVLSPVSIRLRQPIA